MTFNVKPRCAAPHCRLGCNLKLLALLLVWIPVILWPALVTVAAVLVAVVYGGLAPTGLIFQDSWTPCEHLSFTLNMVTDFLRPCASVACALLSF